ncbi:uncharacterized protein VTP21DRAFT_4745 [Calcarisporiella thermophila]|uniref:uncharacterized protein n=1 Tax=Calcarisporiella thermophila TaxID=911321 RepID=UPI0037431E31
MRSNPLISTFVFILATGLATAWPIFTIPELSSPVAPLLSSEASEPVADSYIVVFKDKVDNYRITAHHNWIRSIHDDDPLTKALADQGIASGIRHTYSFKNLKGYAGQFSKDTLEKIRRSEDVEYVERDSMVYTNELQRNAPWGLSRISHREKLNLTTFNKYLYNEKAAGDGVTVYVIDTGVNVNHVDFEGRARWGTTIPDGDEDEDRNGHGTHVAGTIAGKRYGVAKRANVVAVKVLRSNGSGTMSDVIAGVLWAQESHQIAVAEAQRNGTRHRGSVANMSLGGGRSRTLDRAVDAAVDSGVHFAVAAGNDNANCKDYSPAASENAITVGATNVMDERSWFSNYGECVDVFAPGQDITSTWIGSPVATNTISGTSMASPHVAGIVAYFLSQIPEGETITPKQMKDHLTELATKNALKDVPKSTKNYLIYNDPPSFFYLFDK